MRCLLRDLVLCVAMFAAYFYMGLSVVALGGR